MLSLHRADLLRHLYQDRKLSTLPEMGLADDESELFALRRSGQFRAAQIYPLAGQNCPISAQVPFLVCDLMCAGCPGEEGEREEGLDAASIGRKAVDAQPLDGSREAPDCRGH